MLESAQVDYRPTMINLTHVINIVTKELMGTIKAVSRVREALGDTPNAAAKKPPAPAAAGPTAAATATTDTAAAGSNEAAVVGAPVVEGEGAGQVAGDGGGAESAGILPVTQVGSCFRIYYSFGMMFGYRLVSDSILGLF